VAVNIVTTFFIPYINKNNVLKPVVVAASYIRAPDWDRRAGRKFNSFASGG
jgi:hypothetical protein